MSFFLQAGSCTSSRYFPTNTASSFQIKLPYQLDGSKYDVSLINIAFNNNRYFMTNESDRTVRLCFNGEEHVCLIPCIKFATIEELVNCLSGYISDYTNSIQIQYTEDKKVLIKTINSELRISDALATVLGMSESTFTDTVRYGKFCPSLDNIINPVFICMDGVVPQLTGNSYMPYLQVVYPSNSDINIVKCFSPSIVLPLKPHRFEVVHISLQDHCGKEIIVQPSETQIVLHFRFKNGQQLL